MGKLKVETTKSTWVRLEDGPPPDVEQCIECLRWVKSNNYDYETEMCKSCKEKQHGKEI